MKLTLPIIAKILIAIAIFSVFKFSKINPILESEVKSTSQAVLLAETEITKANTTLDMVKGLDKEGVGSNIYVITPSIANSIVKSMDEHNINATIRPNSDGVNVLLNPIPNTANALKYIRFNIIGTFTDYGLFKVFLNNFKKSGMSISKLKIAQKMNFELTVDLIGNDK